MIGDDDDDGIDLAGGAGAEGTSDQAAAGDQQDDNAADATQDDQPGGSAPADVGRAQRREDSIRELLAEQRRHREALERREAELAAREARLNQPAPVDLAAMDPESRLTYHLQQERQERTSHAISTRAEIDQLKFSNYIARNPEYAKYEERVEQLYQQGLRNAAQTGNASALTPRELLLDILVGQDVRKNGAKALKTAQARGQANIQRQTTKPANLSGNVGKTSKQELSPAQAALQRLSGAGQVPPGYYGDR
jgi:hypothetical protein